jgi:hypothetical protein
MNVEKIEERVRARIVELINESRSLSFGHQNNQIIAASKRGECSAWMTSAQNIVRIICTSPTSPYLQKANAVVAKDWGYVIHEGVAELGALLINLLRDADAGLLVSVSDQVRAETFDDFLDHATAYLNDGRKNEAGTIAGVIFEDSIRRVCRKQAIQEKDVKLDQLISKLATMGNLSATKAKRARAAADVRTKATHAQWTEFDESDVQSTIEFTREFIASKLDT